jgi:hypothetical protein
VYKAADIHIQNDIILTESLFQGEVQFLTGGIAHDRFLALIW